MRQIEQEMLNAIKDNRLKWKKDNTEVGQQWKYEDSLVASNKVYYQAVFLFDNKIAEIYSDHLVLFDAGYQTCTTKSRLNALLSYYFPGALIYQTKYQWKIKVAALDTDWSGTIKLYFADNQLKTNEIIYKDEELVL